MAKFHIVADMGAILAVVYRLIELRGLDKDNSVYDSFKSTL